MLKRSDRIGARARLLPVSTIALLAQISIAHAATVSPLGDWVTPDRETGKPRSVVRIEKDGDILVGRIVRGIGHFEQAEKTCSKCTDDRKDKPLLGMDVIRDAREQDDGDQQQWFGEILDPDSGKVFKLRMRVEADGNTLELRGYRGTPMLGRTIEWKRLPPGAQP
ncbi:DUF2147 domain-containing protein [Solimonas marina]|uniref:DUF2147 domain-containing protein n=1 Tax=Solimonas marina TaxID=2714601 RepID=A0A969WC78_9GAMM|nr:DUF2147 domain-containing protein [Solimonas marina]NKF23524.1 DUF2147 domain-containing protein [Solimonas marina]